MKKNLNYYGLFRPKSNWHKFILTMKISAFLLFCSLVNIFATPTYSQSTKISLNLKEVTIEEVLSKIEDESEFYFLYNNKLIDVTRKVNIRADNEPITDILNDILSKDTKFILYDRQIILTPSDITSLSAAIQQLKISGTVTDEKGNPLPGVTILVKGTINGALSDDSGKYVINNVPRDATLIFSFIGMETQEILSEGKMTIDVVLKEFFVGLDEVVVVGYGTQKKINVTGAVSTVGSKSLTDRPITNISNGLQGKLSGVTITTNNGQPGRDGGTINIRGIGTGLGGSPASSGPMVIVDGVVASLGEVNPNDIENISVLKDAASASIYGARASNGVILITTKKGQKESMEIHYDFYIGLQEITRLPDFVPSWQQAQLYNEARTNENAPTKWTDTDIQLFKDGTDLTGAHPNTDWLSLLYSEPGIQQNHNLSVSGGDEKTKYMFSLSYFDQAGNVKGSDYKKYNTRFNLNSELHKKLSINANLAFLYAPFQEPISTYATSFSQLIRQINRISNTVPYKWGNGAYGYVSDGSPMAWLESPSFNKWQNYTLTGNVGADWSPLQGLHFKPSFGYRLSTGQQQQYVSDIQYYKGGPEGTPLTPTKYEGPNNLTNATHRTTYTLLQMLGEYEKTFQKHAIRILAGASQEYSIYNYFSAYRQGFLNNGLSQIDVAPALGQQTSGYSDDWALQSVFGRLNYNYDEKYLFEANLRYDGSSRFAKGKKWGAFPSFSAGWVISKEAFFSNLTNIFSSFKVRASWGKLGNQQISNYPTIATISPGQVYSFNQNLVSGVAPTTGANTDIKWEATETSGIGLDADFFRGKLTLSLDYFLRKTNNILMQPEVGATYALSSPFQNVGAMENKGFELSLGYRGLLNEFQYSVNGNFSYIKNTVTDLHGLGPFISGGTFYDVDYPFRSLYGYECLGIYQNDDEVTGTPVLNNRVAAGDLIYKNQNTDNVIDAKDKVYLGSYFPKVTFGLTADMAWKGFELSLFFQGAAGVKAMGGNLIGQVGNDVQKPTSVFLDRWTEEKPSTTFPRLWYSYNQNDPSINPSSFWVKDASYLRLKNIVLAYNLPKALTGKIGINNIKVYYSGQNLFTLTKFYKWIDPEVGSAGSIYSYPQVKVNTIGLNIIF